MVLEVDSIKSLTKALSILEESFAGMPAFSTEIDGDKIDAVLAEVAVEIVRG